MLSIYPACFLKEENGYTVVFPDLNGTATCGDDIDDAMRYAIDCLAGYLYGLKKENAPLPSPSAMSALNPVAIAAELGVSEEGAFVMMVPVDVEEYAKNHFEEYVETKVSIPSWLNAEAIKGGIDLSETLSSALLQRLRLA